MELVCQWQEELGLNRALALTGLPKSTWYDRQQSKPDKYQTIRRDLKQILKDNAPYGYRRAHAELTDTQDGYGHAVGRETVRALMKEMDMQMAKRPARPRQSPIRAIIREAGSKADRLAQLEAIRSVEAGEAGVTDFTEIAYANGTKKAQLMTILDYCSRAVLGWEVAERKDTQLALAVWQNMKATLGALKHSVRHFIIHSDQDPVLTGHAWARQVAVEDDALLSYSSNGCRGNTRMESWHSRLKEESRGLFADCRTLEDVRETLAQQVRYYNERRRHSSLDNMAPMKYLKNELNVPV